jgi:hypothetical protein
LSETIFSNSHFKYVVEDINNNNIKFDCYIGVKPDSPNQYEFKISKCKFDGALMNRVEISKNTKIEEVTLKQQVYANLNFVIVNFLKLILLAKL